MEVQGHLMQARFIEIHQVFAKKHKVGYFPNRILLIVPCCIKNSVTKRVANYIAFLVYFFAKVVDRRQ